MDAMCRSRGSRVPAFLLLAGSFFATIQSGAAQSTIYSGQAVAVDVHLAGIPVAVSDTGPLPATGGALSTELASLTVTGIANLQLLAASTEGQSGETNSQASIASAWIRAAGITIEASLITANAGASCTGNGVSTSGNSQIASLRVNGLSVKVTGEPNQTIPLLVGSLVINEQISSETGDSASMTVNALHLRVLGLADVILSGTEAGVECASAPPPPPQ